MIMKCKSRNLSRLTTRCWLCGKIGRASLLESHETDNKWVQIKCSCGAGGVKVTVKKSNWAEAIKEALVQWNVLSRIALIVSIQEERDNGFSVVRTEEPIFEVCEGCGKADECKLMRARWENSEREYYDMVFIQCGCGRKGPSGNVIAEGYDVAVGLAIGRWNKEQREEKLQDYEGKMKKP